MSASRRTFLHTLGAGAVALGALPPSLDALAMRAATPADGPPSTFDLTWPTRLRGAHRAVFDVATLDNGHSLWRASVWAAQNAEFLGAKPEDISSVIVIRADAIIFAMQQAYWDAYHPGHKQNVKHPVTGEVTNTNPVLMSSARKEIPAMFDFAQLDQFLMRGGIVLACNLAFKQVTDVIEATDAVSAAQARAKALSLLVPGVILQPSGVFAVVRAQEAGAQYVR